MSKFPNLEHSSLKRDEFFPPDVYFQRARQLEDEMSEKHIGHGFKYQKPVPDEYESCSEDLKNFDFKNLWTLYKNINAKKYSITEISDSRTSQIISGNTNGRHKSLSNDIFADLAGNTSVSSLSRRVGQLNPKRDEIVADLVKYQVPLHRALWFIYRVMSNSVSETIKKKTKVAQEIPMDWTGSIIDLMSKYLNHDEVKFNEMLSNVILPEEWDYLFSLLLSLYDSNTVDHYDVMLWLVKSAENIFSYTKIVSKTLTRLSPKMCSQLKFILPYLLKFGRRFTESEFLTRRLLYWCTSLFSNLIKIDNITNLCLSNVNLQSLFSQYEELMACPMHKVILLTLSSLIISLVLGLPTASVWNSVEYKLEFSFLCGSPLDVLPCPLALLPLPSGSENIFLRNYLIETENFIMQRSHLAENGWSPILNNSISNEVDSSVKILNFLDEHDYNNVTSENFISILANSILEKPLNSQHRCDSFIRFICEWAVTNHRSGLHRAIIVALVMENLKDNTKIGGRLQESLVKFLDKHAPRYHSTSFNVRSVDSDSSFKSLVCLFGELIDRQIFDHDKYIRYCITHNHIDSSYHPLAKSHQPNQLNTSSKYVFSIQSEMSEDNCNSVENPDSVRSDRQFHVGRSSFTLPRHLEYLIHFPIPQDDSYSHEMNQRAQILYGCSRIRDRAKSRLKKLIRDITKLFTKRVYLIDIVNGELGRKKKAKVTPQGESTVNSFLVNPPVQPVDPDSKPTEDVCDDILNRMKALSFFDMEYVISQSTPIYNKMFNTALFSDSIQKANSTNPANIPGISSNSRFLSLPCIIFLFFDIIEGSLNMTQLINILSDTLNYLRFLNVPTDCAALYKSKLCLRIIGMLKKHQAIFVTMPEVQLRVFDNLLVHVKGVKAMDRCKPLERSVLIYLYDLFNSSYIFTRDRIKYKMVLDKVVDLLKAKVRSDQKYSYLPELANDIWNGSAEILREFIKYLGDNPEKRFTFVIKAIKQVCSTKSEEKLHQICILCNEVTAEFITLASDWLNVFHGILANRTNCAYQDLIADIDLTNQSTYSHLATLIETLLAYEYFSVNDLMKNVIFPTLAHILSPDYDCKDCLCVSTSRFAMYILYRLFISDNSSSLIHSTSYNQVQMSPNPYQHQVLGVRFSEPLLVNSSMQRVRIDILVDALKLLILHSDKIQKGTDEIYIANGSLVDLEEFFDDPKQAIDEAYDDGIVGGEEESDELSNSFGYDEDDIGVTLGRKRRKPTGNTANNHQQNNSNNKKRKKSRSSLPNQRKKRILAYRYLHIATKRFIETGQLPSENELFNMRTSDFAHFLIRQICISEWVRRRLVGLTPDILLRKNVMIDKNISEYQGRRLFHIMYWPKDLAWIDPASNDISHSMQSLICNLDIWHLRFAQMEFELQQKSPHVSTDKAIDAVVSYLVRKFQNKTLHWLLAESSNANTNNNNNNAGTDCNSSGQQLPQLSDTFESYGTLPSVNVPSNDSSWLLAPFVGSVSINLRQKIFQYTFNETKSITGFSQIKNDEEKERILLQNSVLLTHAPFFAILKICIKDCNDSYDLLLEQILGFVQNAKETEDRVPDNNRIWQIIQQCLNLRLILVGYKIVKSELENEFVLKCISVLAQLIIYGVVEPNSNKPLFFMTLDMLHNLFHWFLAKTGFTSKNLQKVLKSLRKEISEKPPNAGIEYIRPLLALSKNPPSMFINGVSPYGSTDNLKKAKSKDDKSKVNMSTKLGYAITRREPCTKSLLMDPQKLHLLYNMHGTVFCNIQPQAWTLSQANLLVSHDHPISITRPLAYFIEPMIDPKASHLIERVMRKFIEKFIQSRTKSSEMLPANSKEVDRSEEHTKYRIKPEVKPAQDAFVFNKPPPVVIPSQQQQQQMAKIPAPVNQPQPQIYHQMPTMAQPGPMYHHHQQQQQQQSMPSNMQKFNMPPQKMANINNPTQQQQQQNHQRTSMIPNNMMVNANLPIPQQPQLQQTTKNSSATTTPTKRKRVPKAKANNNNTTPNKSTGQGVNLGRNPTTSVGQHHHPHHHGSMMPNNTTGNNNTSMNANPNHQIDTYTFSAGNSNSGGSMTGWNQSSNPNVSLPMNSQQKEMMDYSVPPGPSGNNDYLLRNFVLHRQSKNNQQHQQQQQQQQHPVNIPTSVMQQQQHQMHPVSMNRRPQQMMDQQPDYNQAFRPQMPDPPPYHAGGFNQQQQGGQIPHQQMVQHQIASHKPNQLQMNPYDNDMNQNYPQYANQHGYMQ